METIEIRETRAEDAKAVLAYLKRIGGESDNLTFDSNGLPITEEQEASFLERVHNDPKSIQLIALKNGSIIADGSISAFPRRMSHRADLGISVVREEWNHGIGSMLMERLIDFARNSGIELINLEVRADNDNAIHLYEKYGFRSIGTSPAYFKIGDQHFDFVLMVLDLRTDSYTIRRLTEDEIPAALDLAWKVFSEYESPDYSAEGTEEFRKCLHDDKYLAGIAYYGAFDGRRLIGLIGIRPDVGHICFFFVDGSYHRRGIGTRMFRYLLESYTGDKITLNSSPYGVPFYKVIGFAATEDEKTVNGIRFTPMEYKR